jgi:predicted acyltransferase
MPPATLVPPTEGAVATRPAAPHAAPTPAPARVPPPPGSPERADDRTRERLLSLDVFRGLTIAGMLLVNNPGSWATIYPPLRHAPWHGWTPTDLIFPFFLFIVGITTHLSLSARASRGDDLGALRRQVFRRAALIFLAGFLLSLFPGFTWGAVEGVAEPTFLQRVVDRLEHVRIMGVLQRIALAYCFGALLTLRTTVKQQVVILAALLFGYWFAMTLLPVPDHGMPGANVLHRPEAVLSAWLDRQLLDWGRFGNHLWASSRTWDPEGILSTIPAVGTVILGVMCGRWIGAARPLSERLAGMFAVGSLLMVAGLMWNWSFPINKSLWTSSYALFTGGMAAVTLATCMWVIDDQRVTWWTRPFVIYGTNPTIAFVGSGVMARLIYSMIRVERDGRPVSLQGATYQSLYASWLPAEAASLAFAVSFVLVWLGILWLLNRRGIFLKF